MRLRLFQVDAFADRVFEGNPAAVCPLDAWIDDEWLQAIAAEQNLSETAFFAREGDAFRLRWFTPVAEVDLCGHATLASAHVLFEHLGYDDEAVRFETRSGPLVVTRGHEGLSMDFPAAEPRPVEIPAALVAGLGRAPREVLAGFDYVAVFDHEDEVIRLRPDFAALAGVELRGVVATAPGTDADFVSRCFFPRLGVNEDPVTGSAHCELAPYWARRLGRNHLVGRQRSRRGGTVVCECRGDRLLLSGRAVTYLTGEIRLDI